jgi:hypothetical protein
VEQSLVILPHDGEHGDKAGFDVLVIPNCGAAKAQLKP